MCTKSNKSSENIQISDFPELKDNLIPFDGSENIRYLFGPETPVDLLKNKFDQSHYNIAEYTSWEKPGLVRMCFTVTDK